MKPLTRFLTTCRCTPRQLALAGLLAGTPLAASAQEAAPVPVQYRIMHLSQEQRQQMLIAHLSAPRASVPSYATKDFAASLSLLSHLPYVPSQRNQGACADCWQWAGTGVMEVAHDVQDGIFDRLSVQFINSCQQEANCCDGGWLEYVADFYSTTRKYAIPWTNANARFSSGQGDCSQAPCATIATNPQYSIKSISAVSIDTSSVGQNQAIANIKSVLNQNKAVWFAFWLPTDAAWQQFDTFWSSQPESAVWNDFYCDVPGDSGGGGHAVLCVGYNDDSPTNRYWIILNSWGVTSKRPNGLFRVSMDLNYDCTDADGYPTLQWETLNIAFTPLGPTINTQPQSQTVVLGSSATFTVGATSPDQPLTYQWRKEGVPLAGATNSLYTITSAKFSDAGSYSVRVANPKASTTSSNALLTVSPPVSLPFALNNSNLTWTTGTNTFWYGQTDISHDGVASAQSFPIGDGQQSSLSATVTGPATLSFWWKVSSQTNADLFRFRASGGGLTNAAQRSGEADWAQARVFLPNGPQALDWTYMKNASGSTGLDAAWVDEVTFATGFTLPFILTQPASQSCLAGSTVAFAVSADGTPVLTYQWARNGSSIPGATNTGLTLPCAGASDQGGYSVRVANPYGATDSANAALTVVPVAIIGDDSLGQLNVPTTATNALAVVAGAWHNLALLDNGLLLAWGNNGNGQCDVPADLRDAVAIAAGGYHSLALRANLTVTGWGANADGQATPPPGLINVIAIAAGIWHSLALRADGTVAAWGDNTWGQTSVPSDLTNAVAIAAQGNHSLALRADGTVAAWGENTDALGYYAGQSVVPWDLTNVVMIAAGEYHSLALKRDETLVAWGDDSEGQTDAPGCLAGIVAVAAGGSHSLALKADGTVAAWGNNWNGQCAIPATLSNVVALAAGTAHSLLLQRDTPSTPKPFHPARLGDQFTTLVLTVAGRNYALECKTSVTASNWATLPPVYGNGSLQFLIDRNATDYQRYYRVRQW